MVVKQSLMKIFGSMGISLTPVQIESLDEGDQNTNKLVSLKKAYEI